MDISYLLFLQDFRNSINNAWTPFMESISLSAVTYLILLPAFIYWCIDKRKGLFTLAAYNICVAFNALVKLTACVYRPWIRDARVIPAGEAIHTATGYSFPSGHTTTAVPIYGGMAVGFWNNKKTRWLGIICILAILVTGFSRNYLGVHTPQDVLVGLVLGVFSLWLTWKIFKYVSAHPETENWFLLGGIVFAALALVYITFKPYPMDYIDGKLLVDPQRMMNDGYKDIGSLAAFCVARYVEKRWIKFEVPGFNFKGIALGILGLIPAVLMVKYLSKPCIEWLGPHWGRVLYQGTFIFYIVAFYPFVLKLFGKKPAK